MDQAAFGIGAFDAGELRALFDRYGQPFNDDHVAADRGLLAMTNVEVRRLEEPRGTCRGATTTLSLSPEQLPLYLWSDADSWTVEARRFGDTWIEVVGAGSGQVVDESLPRTAADRLWQVRAGACQVGTGVWTR